MGAKHKITEIPVRSIEISPLKIRREIASGDTDELAASLDEVGVIQPIVVRQADGGKYELLVGERRLEAARQAKLGRVPAIVFEGDDSEAELLSIESDLRVYPPTPAEREKLLERDEELYVGKHGHARKGRPSKGVARRESFASTAAAATRKTTSTIYRDLARRKKLTEPAKAALDAGTITPSHADELVKLPPEQQNEVLEAIQGTTRDQAREIVQSVSRPLAPTPVAPTTVHAPPPAPPPRPRPAPESPGEQRLLVALQLLRTHHEALRPVLKEVQKMILGAIPSLQPHDVEGPDAVLVEIHKEIHRIGDALSETGHLIQRIRHGFFRRVRADPPATGMFASDTRPQAPGPVTTAATMEDIPEDDSESS